MVKKISYLFISLVLILFIISMIAVISAPKVSSIQQTIVINEDPQNIWPYVATFEERQKWNPFIKGIKGLDTQITGEDGQVGSILSWTSKESAGEQTITEIIPEQRFASDLTFTVPMQGTAKESTVLVPLGPGQTQVEWNYVQPNEDFFSKLFVGLGFFKKMMNKSYSRGLVELKNLSDH